MFSEMSSMEEFWKQVNFIAIDSNLIPYVAPEEFEKITSKNLKEGEKYSGFTSRNKFQFSGKYGTNLMEEVARYALVALR